MKTKRYQLIYQYEKEHFWYQGRLKLLLRLIGWLQIKKPAKILDVGCGTGYLISRLNKFSQAYGVDISPLAISYCQNRGLKNVHLIKAGQKYPFKHNFF